MRGETRFQIGHLKFTGRMEAREPCDILYIHVRLYLLPARYSTHVHEDAQVTKRI